MNADAGVVMLIFTFTLQGTTGNVCGGFSDVPWTSKTPPRGRFISSTKYVPNSNFI